MNPLTLLIIYFTIFSGPMITLLSSNLLLMWVGLEMSLLAIIPLLMTKHNPRSTESATKYFITQATASMIFLLAITINFKQLGMWSFQPQTHTMIFNLTFLALAIKIGLAPLHAWLPEVVQGTSFTTGLILLTWQKVAPLSIMYQIYNTVDITIIIFFAISSVLVGGWNGLNQTQTRKIMAYSSITHMGWMVAILPYNPNLMFFNLTIYIFLTLSMFIMLSLFSFSSINSISLSWNKMPFILPTTSIILLSLGGLPPLTGFLPKWAIVTELLKNNNTTLATFMAMVTLLNLFFYMRLIYSTSLTLFPTNNNIKMINHQTNPKYNMLLPTFIIISSFSLPLFPQMM